MYGTESGKIVCVRYAPAAFHVRIHGLDDGYNTHYGDGVSTLTVFARIMRENVVLLGRG